MTNIEKIRLNLKTYIVNSGLELNTIAECMGVSLKTLNNYLSGRTMPRLLQIRNLCKLLNIKAQSLLGLDDED